MSPGTVLRLALILRLRCTPQLPGLLRKRIEPLTGNRYGRNDSPCGGPGAESRNRITPPYCRGASPQPCLRLLPVRHSAPLDLRHGKPGPSRPSPPPACQKSAFQDKIRAPGSVSRTGNVDIRSVGPALSRTEPAPPSLQLQVEAPDPRTAPLQTAYVPATRALSLLAFTEDTAHYRPAVPIPGGAACTPQCQRKTEPMHLSSEQWSILIPIGIAVLFLLWFLWNLWQEGK